MESNKPNFLEDMTFIDSWKDHHVQLLGGGALAIGTGALIAQDKTPDIGRAFGKAYKQVEKSWEKFLFRGALKSGKIYYPIAKLVTKDTLRELKELQKKHKPLTREEFFASVKEEQESLSPHKINDMAIKLRDEAEDKWRKKNIINNTSTPFSPHPFTEYQEKAKMLLLAPQENQKPGGKAFGKTEETSIFTKEKGLKAASDIVGATLAGAAFAGGITIVHGFNKHPDAKKSFEVAGSYIKDDKRTDKDYRQNNRRHNNDNQSFRSNNHSQNNFSNQSFKPRHSNQNNNQSYQNKNQYKGYSNMKNNYNANNTKPNQPKIQKEASARDLYDGLYGTPAKKVGNAILSGLGFGGVSYGLTEMNKNRLKKEDDKNNKSNRIIIEFGDDDTADSNSLDGGTGLIPRPNFNKEAKFQQFLKNLGGRKRELRELDTRLKNHNYHKDAVTNANNKDHTPDVQPYYNLYEDKSQAMNRYLDDARDSLKQVDQNKIEQIKDDVAKARLPVFLTGTGLAGAAGAYQLRKDDER